MKGTAYTLVTEKDKEFAGEDGIYHIYHWRRVHILLAYLFVALLLGHIVRNLEAANQEVPKDLMDLAMKSSWFKNSR